MSFINTATYGSLSTSNINTSSFTASNASVSTFTANGLTTVQQITEKFNTFTGQTGGVTHDFASTAIWYHSSINGNITALFTNVPQISSRSAVATLVFNQGASPFYASNISVNTSSVTIKWANATIPTPAANRTEVESFTLLNVGGIWTALGQYTSFG